MDELHLIKQIQRKGNNASADKLIRQYYDQIYYFVKKQINDKDCALDLTQEIFISCLRTIKHYDHKKDTSFKTWLYKIASNKVVDYYRSRSHSEMMKTLPLDEIEPIDEADFVKKLENSDFALKVCSFIENLPPETQKIFRLHIFEELTFAEIAKDVGLPESSVKSKYYRLMSRLRKEFSNYE